MAYFRLLRPEQWVKNLFLFAGLLFGQKLSDPLSVAASLAGFALFCLLSSAMYVINDIRDAAEDRLHPRKRLRPLAAGLVSPGAAAGLSVALIVVGLAGAWWLDRGFAAVATTYLLLQAAYNAGLKHAAILDVICIGAGFVLRAVAGAVLVHVEVSVWLVLCTFTLCLFMGFSKRRCELNALAGAAPAAHRRTLAMYTPDLLNHMTTLTAGVAIVSFMLYATDEVTIQKFHSNYLLYTLPIVVYAVFRFALRVERGDVDGPTDVLLRDRPFQIAIVLWVLAATSIVYGGNRIAAALQWLSGDAAA